MATTVYDKSIFKPFFDSNDSGAAAWAANVLSKLIENGEVAKYIKRYTENGTATEFEKVFEPTTIFFSYLVQLAREYRDFKLDSYLIESYLKNTGQLTCSEETLVQLQYLVSNLLRVRSERGSLSMIYQSPDISIPHGELLRLLCWNATTFFKLGVARPQHNSWNVNNSSPLNRSNTGRYDLNLAWEYTEGVESLTPYPLLQPSYITLDSYRGKQCLHIEQVPFGETAGIGGSDTSKAIIIDPRLNYEITFYIAQDVTLENISFGCLAFDALGDPISLKNVVTDANQNWFFETRRLNQVGKFYMIRGIVYNTNINTLTQDEARLNIGFGTNLKSTDDVAMIIPYIHMDNNMTDDSDSASDNFDSTSIDTDPGASESGLWSDGAYDSEPSIYLWNIKVTPCNTYYNRCYLNNKNFIDIYSNNNNGQFTNQQIDVILRKYFIPYNTAFKNTAIGSISEINPSQFYLLLEDGSYMLLENENRVLLEVN
jgi:hypothetical protein